jgi:triacylglycerol lipase
MKEFTQSLLLKLNDCYSKRFRRWISVAIITSLLLVSCQINRAEMPYYDDSIDIASRNEHVIILHGLWRTSFAMNKAEAFFQEQGYQVHNLSYPSTEDTIESLVALYLAPEFAKISKQQPNTIHFVTHSMGGILVRQFLQDHRPQNLGKVVMIAPPNSGSQLNDVFPDAKWLHSRPGPAAMQISALPDSWVNQLGPVNFELGVIAGNSNRNWLTDWLIPSDDDGAVSVASTRVEGMDDFLIVPQSHVKIRRSETVLKQAAHYLKYGVFYRKASSLAQSK